MSKEDPHEWGVIGGGPAGIAAIGKILDSGVPAHQVIWVDPKFKGGDLGSYWHQVDSNTTVDLFQKFAEYFQCFETESLRHLPIFQCVPGETCKLEAFTELMLGITEVLTRKVHAVKGIVQSLEDEGPVWAMEFRSGEPTLYTRRLVLATGADPKEVNYPDKPAIPLHVALNPLVLADNLVPGDKVAVIGGSHSAIHVLRNLLAIPNIEVFNFYRSPVKLAVKDESGQYILWDNSGLKGITREWAVQDMHNQDRLTRISVSEPHHAEVLEKCNKIVSAVGFTPRDALLKPGMKFDPHSGILAPRLFGVGIGFPKEVTDKFGHRELNVGVWKFKKFLDEVFPLWQVYC